MKPQTHPEAANVESGLFGASGPWDEPRTLVLFAPDRHRDFSAALPVHGAEAEALSFKPQIPPALGPPALGAGLSSPDLEPGRENRR